MRLGTLGTTRDSRNVAGGGKLKAQVLYLYCSAANRKGCSAGHNYTKLWRVNGHLACGRGRKPLSFEARRLNFVCRAQLRHSMTYESVKPAVSNLTFVTSGNDKVTEVLFLNFTFQRYSGCEDGVSGQDGVRMGSGLLATCLAERGSSIG